MTGRTPDRRRILILGTMAAMAVGAAFLEPIRQDPTYHDFADKRALLGVPNFGDVVSNLGFLAVGLVGLRLGVEAKAWKVFFAGVALVSLGSGYYHLDPDNTRLVWDRLPMSVAFMAALVAVATDHIHERLERWAVVPAVLVGIGSVYYWSATDDLRPYLWVQFMPLVIIPIIVLSYGSRYARATYLLWAVAWYGVAKVCEVKDAELFTGTGGLVSGHTLKHLVAAWALLWIYRMLRRGRNQRRS